LKVDKVYSVPITLLHGMISGRLGEARLATPIAVLCVAAVGCGAPTPPRGEQLVRVAARPDPAAADGGVRAEPSPGLYKLAGWELGGLGHSDGVGEAARVGEDPLMVVDGTRILVVVGNALRSIDPRAGSIRTIARFDVSARFASAAFDARRRELVLLDSGHVWRVTTSGTNLREVATLPELPESRIDQHVGTVPLAVVKGRTFFADSNALFEVVGRTVVRRTKVCAQTLVADGDDLLVLARTGHVHTYNPRTNKASILFTPTEPRRCGDWELDAFFLGTSFYLPADRARIDVSTKRLVAEPALERLPRVANPSFVVDGDRSVWLGIDGRIAKFDGNTFTHLLDVGRYEPWHRRSKALGAIELCREGDTLRFRCRAPALDRKGEDVCTFGITSQQAQRAAELCGKAERRAREMFALLPSHYAGAPVESAARIDDERIGLISQSTCEACDGKLAIFKLSDNSIRDLASFAGDDPGPGRPRDLACTDRACFVAVGTRVDRVDLATGARRTVVGAAGHDALRPGPLPAGLGEIHGLLTSERGLYILTEGVLAEAVLPADLR